ncbi:MAG: hypothetical protein GY943_01395 [Chloroflexi bacterium]|nr:hypothetical protein [Chloroflexota bacterium]
MNKKITMYGTPTCPMVPPVKGMLKRANAEFEYINIMRDEEGRSHVRAINQGNESVPTLVFADGTTLTEPSSRELKEKLEANGYQLSPPSVLDSLKENVVTTLIALFLIGVGASNGTALLVVIGFVVLGMIVVNGRLSHR